MPKTLPYERLHRERLELVQQLPIVGMLYEIEKHPKVAKSAMAKQGIHFVQGTQLVAIRAMSDPEDVRFLVKDAAKSFDSAATLRISVSAGCMFGKRMDCLKFMGFVTIHADTRSHLATACPSYHYSLMTYNGKMRVRGVPITIAYNTETSENLSVQA